VEIKGTEKRNKNDFTRKCYDILKFAAHCCCRVFGMLMNKFAFLSIPGATAPEPHIKKPGAGVEI
jgi:hypothetical protein